MVSRNGYQVTATIPSENSDNEGLFSEAQGLWTLLGKPKALGSVRRTAKTEQKSNNSQAIIELVFDGHDGFALALFLYALGVEVRMCVCVCVYLCEREREKQDRHREERTVLGSPVIDVLCTRESPQNL